MEKLARVALGRIAAVERVCAVIIATHPAPEALAEAWQALSPGWREDLQHEYADDPDFLGAAMKALDRFDHHIARVAAKHPSGGPKNH